MFSKINHDVCRHAVDFLGHESVKPDKEKSTEKIDGVVALVMALDRAQCHLNDGSVYDDRGLMTLDW